MLISDQMPEKIKEISTLFNDAERAMKKVEHIDKRIIVPSVNELRYVGHHLAKACTESVEEKQKEELNKALKHAKRGYYDAVEVGVLYYLERFGEFQDDYRIVMLKDMVPNYFDLCEKAQAANEMFTNIPREDRQDYYKECERQLQILADVVKKLEICRSEINKQVLSQAKSERLKNVMIGSVIMGVIVAGVVGFKAEIKEFVLSGQPAIALPDTPPANSQEILPNSLPNNAATPAD